jgi:hypothetical protein
VVVVYFLLTNDQSDETRRSMALALFLELAGDRLCGLHAYMDWYDLLASRLLVSSSPRTAAFGCD